MGYYSGLLGFIQNQQGLGENQRQFNANFGENARQFDNQFLEGQRRYDSDFMEGRRQFNNQFQEGQRQYDNSFLEGQRQYDNNFLEGQRQYDNNFLEGQRQFDTSIGENARQFNLGMGQDYDQMMMQLLPILFNIDQGLFARDAEAYGINQGEQQRQFGNNASLLGLIPQPQNAPVNVGGAYGVASNAAAQQAQIQQQQNDSFFGGLGSILSAWNPFDWKGIG